MIIGAIVAHAMFTRKRHASHDAAAIWRLLDVTMPSFRALLPLRCVDYYA